jgi:alpha-methylacyl-CoA racemase
MASGPLKGVKIVEMAGIGPGPLAATMLSDMGADIIRVDRKSGPRINPMSGTKYEFDGRGRRSVTIDLKNPQGTAACLELIDRADIVIEGFRPGVMERLGLGPEVALARNPKLVFGRMTGWGQDGPYAQMAGHDYNYVAISGAAYAIGTKEHPVPPLNYVGDYAGTLVLVSGVLAALNHATRTGEGQVVDTAMCEAASFISAGFHAMRAIGYYKEERLANELDGGAPYYGAYRCKDDEWITIGSIEPQFYAELLVKLELTDRFADCQRDPARHAEMRAAFTEVIGGKTRAEWCEIMEGSDVCFAPIVRFSEAPDHPHMKARGHFVTVDGAVQPGPVPRFLGTPGAIQGGPPKIGEHNESALLDWGISAERIQQLSKGGVL